MPWAVAIPPAATADQITLVDEVKSPCEWNVAASLVSWHGRHFLRSLCVCIYARSGYSRNAPIAFRRACLPSSIHICERPQSHGFSLVTDLRRPDPLHWESTQFPTSVGPFWPLGIDLVCGHQVLKFAHESFFWCSSFSGSGAGRFDLETGL
jgi:hypothetical protein